jgi:nucleoside-diphosphate-sugar epimerase
MAEAEILVTGAGGFIGGHLVAALRRARPGAIRAVDLKPPASWYQRFEDVDNRQLDLRLRRHCDEAADGVETVYQLAADMGGMGFISSNKASCMLSVLTDTHMLVAARDRGARRLFYASSACVYNVDKQRSCDGTPLREDDAYPAMPEDGYGWEKLFSERMCRHFSEDFGLQIRIARLHNVYGPFGTWDGGREKAPAAICRKVVAAVVSGDHHIEIWGDGRQRRSFMCIDDCIEGIQRIMASDVDVPLNLGSSETVTIDGLVDVVEEIAGIRLRRSYRLDAPTGVNGRSSDNSMILERLGWQPSIPLVAGIEKTYEWIYDQYLAREKRLPHQV